MPDRPTFRHTVRVPYAHVDQMKFVYYANYFVYFEMIRSEMLRQIGVPYSELEKAGVILPVIEAHCAYTAPAHYDELLDIWARCALQGPRLRVDYELWRAATPIANGYTVHVCMAPDGKVLRPPAALRRLEEPRDRGA